MRKLTAGLVGLLGMWYCTAALAAPSPSQPVDVRNLITVTQFHEAGLETLSPQQLDALNSWLTGFLSTHPHAPVDVRSVITVTQFDQTGLDKLSSGQMAAFNNWLDQYLSARTVGATVSAKPPPAPQTAASAVASFGADTMKPRENPATPDHIESRIAGMFTGWDGDTIFKLENGQVWQQAGTGYFTNVNLDHPEVVIKKLMFGYLLTLPGHGETVFVRRIK